MNKYKVDNQIDLPFHACYGCFACYNICPVSAISMKMNKGFYYPYIDNKKCIGCKLCQKVCEKQEEIENSTPIKYLAGKSCSSDIVYSSSSGGVFSELAKQVIIEGGSVIGCTSDREKVFHVVASSKEEIVLFRGSKYVQSNIQNCFKIAKELLKKGAVLFSGTPCQIAGLKAYLGKEYENLILVDVFCHGVPSPMIFEQYIDWLEQKTNKKVKKYTFRGKYLGWDENFRIQFEDGKEKVGPALISSFYRLFLDSKINNYTCSTCKYKSINRCSDLSLGDCWNIEKVTEDHEFYEGATTILVNTDKGQKLISRISCDELKLIHIDRDFIISNNTGALTNNKNEENENILIEEWNEKGYSFINKYYLTKYRKKLVVNRIGSLFSPKFKQIIKKAYKKMKGVIE